MIRLLQTNHPAVYLYLLLYTVLVRGAALLAEGTHTIGFDPWLCSQLFDRSLQVTLPALWIQPADMVLVFTEALIFNYILATRGIADRRSAVAAFMYITLMSFIGIWVVRHEVVAINILLLSALLIILRFDSDELGRQRIYYSALLTGLASFIYLPALLLF
ncbi:MAG: hypothetical protein M3Q97_07455, partial [Bacteroidota bacterium]|nr:hypothetical protein [Bacteroidota bacterium]